MQKKLTVVVFILVMQACVPLIVQTQAPTPEEPDRPGILQGLEERIGEVQAKVEKAGEMVKDFADAFYEGHIEPVTKPYLDWVSKTTNFLWDNLKRTIYPDILGTTVTPVPSN